MSSLIAIFDRRGEPAGREPLAAMLAVRPERGPDGSTIHADGPLALGFQKFSLLPEERLERQPLVMDDVWLAADCRLDNRGELAGQLGLDALQAAAASDALLILLAYRRWGDECPARLLGDFAFIIWDKPRQRLFAARDPLGARGLVYYIDRGLCLMASEVGQLLAHPAVRPRLNDNRVAAFLANVWDRPEESFYHDISYLSPAHSLAVTADAVTRQAYWELRPLTIRYRDEREYGDHYRELVTGAVRDRLRVNGPVGLSLSGGLDSSTLAALTARLLPETGLQRRLKSFSYAFDELASCDERVFIRPVVDRYDIDATYVPGDELWTFRDMAEWPATPDYIMADPYIRLPLAAMAAASRAGVRLLMGGYFGDVLMTGQHYWALDMLRGGKFGLLARTMGDNPRGFYWRQSLVEYGLRRFIPPGLARRYRQVRPRRAVVAVPGIHDDLIARTDLLERLSPPTPPAALGAPGLWQRAQAMMGSAFSQGFPTTRYLYNRHGLELALPYYDRRLIEYVLAIPAYILGRPGGERRLHREAMRDLLPDEVRLRARPTSFLPLMMKGLNDRERETKRAIMTGAQVVERGYIRADWWAAQVEREYDLSADSYALWLGLSLELWLRRFWT